MALQLSTMLHKEGTQNVQKSYFKMVRTLMEKVAFCTWIKMYPHEEKLLER